MAYLNQNIPEAFLPGEYLAEEIDARGWSQVDFSEILGVPNSLVCDIINGRRKITTRIAQLLSQALNTSAQSWLNLQSSYDLTITKNNSGDAIQRRAKLYSLAPVREMVRRGWITYSNNIETLEANICEFYQTDDIEKLEENLSC